jgi:cation diffusion facilitator CzcD-associated flavoprotein CzcO
MSHSTSNNRVCIIGGGPAGLSTGRALKLAGIEFDILEKHSDVGGILDPTNPGSPMYESAHFISSKTMSGHHDFPMPDAYPDYPSNRQVLAYIRKFSEAFGLREHIQFGILVEDAQYEDGLWTLETNQGVREGYRWLVAANGVTWFPKSPEIPGQESFTGEIMHSVKYHKREQVKGKRLLIIGAGNSGVDIACDAANVAEEATVSLRRG